jgi:hypothetical protein
MKQNLSALLATVALLASLQPTPTCALQIASSKLNEPSSPVLNQVNIDLEQASATSEDNDSDQPQQYTNDDQSTLDVQADDDTQDDTQDDDTQDTEDVEETEET